MKKVLSFIIISLILITPSFLTACKEENLLDNSVYFRQNVSATIFGASSPETISINDISRSNPNSLKRYLKFEIKANKDYFYGLYIESIEFYIYTNTTPTEETEFDFILTGTKNGQTTGGSEITTFEKRQLPIKLEKNIPTKIKIAVNDKINLYSTDSVITIKLSDTYTDHGFDYCIYNFRVIGYHK